MELGVMGPLELRLGATSIEIPSRTQRRLLAFLATAAPIPMSVDRIADALWGEKQPDNPDTSIRFHVSKLRSTLGGSRDVLVTVPGVGYTLDLDNAEIDTHEFEALIAEARVEMGPNPHRAAQLLQKAAGLSRGPILVEFEYDQWAQPEINRYEELLVEVRELLIEARLAIGEHRATVSELRSLIVQNPYREKLRYLLMLALYRSGNQTDALAAYRDAADILGEGFGLDPYPELQRLELKILDQAEELLIPAARDPYPSRLPRPVSEFVGRRDELAKLLKHLEDFRFVVVTGIPGAGKTRLLLEAAHRLTESGKSIHWLGPDPGSDLLRSISRALDIRVPDAQDSIEAIAAKLGDRELLIAIDSMQLDTEISTQLELLLTQAGRLRIVATSRLRFDSEAAAFIPVGPMLESDAIDLALERTRMAGVAAPAMDTATSLAEAAGRIPGAVVAGAVSASFGAYEARATDALEDAQRWAESNLSEAEIDAWHILSLFAASIPAEAAIELAAPHPRDAQATLRRLIQVGILSPDTDSYIMGHPLRRTSTVHQTHRDRHAEWVEHQIVSRPGDGPMPSVEDTDTALAHLSATSPGRAAELAAAMGKHWWSNGHTERAVNWYRRLIHPGLSPSSVETAASAAVACSIGIGNLPEAERFAEMQAVAAASLPAPAQAHVMMSRGGIAWEEGDLVGAAALYEQASARFASLAHPDAATALSSQATVSVWTGNPNARRQIHHLASALGRHDLADLLEVDLGLVEGAYEDAIDLARSSRRSDGPITPQSARRLVRREALAEVNRHQPNRALYLVEQWRRMTPKLADPSAEAEARAVEVRAHAANGDGRAAERAYGWIARIAHHLHQPVTLREALLAKHTIARDAADDIAATILALETRSGLVRIPWGIEALPTTGIGRDPIAVLTDA